MTFKLKNNNALTKAVIKPDQKDQNKALNSKVNQISIKHTANYQLTSTNKISKINQKYLTALQEINKSSILISFANAYKLDLTNPDDSTKYVSLINDIFLSNNKLNLLAKYTTISDIKEKYKKLLLLNSCRCDIMYIIYDQIPEIATNIWENNVMQYLKQSIDNIYPVNSLYEILDQISEDLINSYNDAIENKQDLSEEKFSLIHKLNVPLNDLNNKLITGFKSSYNIYKNVLQLSLSTIQLKMTPLYDKAHQLLLTQIHKLIPINLTNFCDHHYFLHLLRVYSYGTHPTDNYPYPLFSDIEKNQINGYLQELENLLMISIILNIHNSNNNAFNILTNLPISQSINKKPSLFFGQQLSKNTYSLLLTYLGLTNIALSNSFIQIYRKSTN